MYLTSAFVYLTFSLTSFAYGQVLIVNGQNAALGQFPYAASLQYRGSHICGGSILARNWILTAAHCGTDVANNLNALRILVGTATLNSGGTYYRLAKFIIHENFRPRSNYIENDIALIKLTTSITFNGNTQRITPATTTPNAGTRATVIGWGLNENNAIPNRLQYLSVTTVSLQTCRNRNYPVVPRGPQICAVADTNNAGVCNGDSGSALIYRNTQIGIVSWGTGGCANGRPTGYTDVAGFRQWIQTNMANN